MVDTRNLVSPQIDPGSWVPFKNKSRKESFRRSKLFRQILNISSLMQTERFETLLPWPKYNFNWRVITRKARRLKKKVFRDSCIQITLLVRQGWNGLRAVDSDMLSRWPLNVIKRICDRISGLVRKIRMTNGPRYSVRNHSPLPRPFFPPFFWFMLRAGGERAS